MVHNSVQTNALSRPCVFDGRASSGRLIRQPVSSPWLAWLPVVMCLVVAFCLRSSLLPWAFMWVLVLAIFAGCKWLTWWQAAPGAGRTSIERSLGYLFFWPGMDAAAFLNMSVSTPKPRVVSWLSAAFKMLLGIVILWGVAPLVPSEQTLIAGWIGLIGIAFLVHFGAFHALALIWQRSGVAAQPIFCSPVLARSLSDFWSARWNLAFRQLAHDLVFRPLVRRLGLSGATLATFLVSGLMHDLVISLPARAGYGLPTLYFTIQGLGVMLQHSLPGNRLHLRRGVGGWLFAFTVTVGPAFWLFHPPFVTGVVVPFLHVIGA